jgi:hypothetical protein
MLFDRSRRSTFIVSIGLFIFPLVGAGVVSGSGCSDDSDGGQTAGTAGSSGSDGGACGAPVPSTAADTHCIGDDGGKIIEEATMCAMEGSDSGAGESDAGEEPLPPPHEGTEADDDDCKFHVSYSATCVAGGVNFTVTPTFLEDMSKATGAVPYIEAFLTETHPAADSGTATESDGVYTIGPVKFDQPGKWTVRFHFYPLCLDTAGSKHSHVAFYFNVP